MQSQHTRLTCSVALTSLLVFGLAGSGSIQAADLTIQNVTVISPERTSRLANATVTIRDGKIESVLDADVAPAANVSILDGSGLYLVPGLMDSHLHTSVIPGIGFHGGNRARVHSEMAALYNKQFSRSLLYFGVTQVLDPAAHPEALERARTRAPGPDIFHCGATPLATGYPAIFLDPGAIGETLPYRIYEDPERARKDGVDPSQHTPEAVIQRVRDDGAICVKMFFEDGWDLRSDWPMLSEESTTRTIRAAHEANLQVVAHANAVDMQQLAVKAGVDVIGHGLWNWNQYSREDGVPEAIRKHLDNIKQRNIGYQPTLRVMDSMRELFMPTMLDDPALKRVVPAPLLAWYRTHDAHDFKRSLIAEDFDNLPEQRIAKLIRTPISRSERTVRYLADIGHPLLLASDHPATPGHANHPGLSTYQEIAHMASLGVSLKAIFEAATINNAKMFGLENRYGSVEAGKQANLLLLGENPLDSVEAYDTIKYVILRGEVLDRESLAADVGE